MKPKYLDAGQVWEIEHPQVVFRGVLIPIRRNTGSNLDLFTGGIHDIPFSRGFLKPLPCWDFCGYLLNVDEAEDLLLRGENARCVFNPWAEPSND